MGPPRCVVHSPEDADSPNIIPRAGDGAYVRSASSWPRGRGHATPPAWYERGLDLYARHPDKGWSLTDCISFAVMTDRGIVEALTADRHFEQAGCRAPLRPR